MLLLACICQGPAGYIWLLHMCTPSSETSQPKMVLHLQIGQHDVQQICWHILHEDILLHPPHLCHQAHGHNPRHCYIGLISKIGIFCLGPWRPCGGSPVDYIGAFNSTGELKEQAAAALDPGLIAWLIALPTVTASRCSAEACAALIGPAGWPHYRCIVAGCCAPVSAFCCAVAKRACKSPLLACQLCT